MTAATSHDANPEPAPDEKWVTGRRLYEVDGLSLREIGAQIGVAHETVRRRVIAEGWERDDEAVAAQDVKRRQIADKMVVGAEIKWAERRSIEADEAGATARLARQRIVVAMTEGDWHMTRAASIAYGILVDKSQLLSGGATSRVDDATMRERAAAATSARDELAARRSAVAS